MSSPWLPSGSQALPLMLYVVPGWRAVKVTLVSDVLSLTCVSEPSMVMTRLYSTAWSTGFHFITMMSLLGELEIRSGATNTANREKNYLITEGIEHVGKTASHRQRLNSYCPSFDHYNWKKILSKLNVQSTQIWKFIIYSPSFNSKPVWVSFFSGTPNKVFWRMLVTKLFWVPLTPISICFVYYRSPWDHLVTSMLENVFFCVP